MAPTLFSKNVIERIHGILRSINQKAREHTIERGLIEFDQIRIGLDTIYVPLNVTKALVPFLKRLIQPVDVLLAGRSSRAVFDYGFNPAIIDEFGALWKALDLVSKTAIDFKSQDRDILLGFLHSILDVESQDLNSAAFGYVDSFMQKIPLAPAFAEIQRYAAGSQGAFLTRNELLQYLLTKFDSELTPLFTTYKLRSQATMLKYFLEDLVPKKNNRMVTFSEAQPTEAAEMRTADLRSVLSVVMMRQKTMVARENALLAYLRANDFPTYLRFFTKNVRESYFKFLSKRLEPMSNLLILNDDPVEVQLQKGLFRLLGSSFSIYEHISYYIPEDCLTSINSKIIQEAEVLTQLSANSLIDLAGFFPDFKGKSVWLRNRTLSFCGEPAQFLDYLKQEWQADPITRLFPLLSNNDSVAQSAAEALINFMQKVKAHFPKSDYGLILLGLETNFSLLGSLQRMRSVAAALESNITELLNIFESTVLANPITEAWQCEVQMQEKEAFFDLLLLNNDNAEIHNFDVSKFKNALQLIKYSACIPREKYQWDFWQLFFTKAIPVLQKLNTCVLVSLKSEAAYANGVRKVFNDIMQYDFAWTPADRKAQVAAIRDKAEGAILFKPYIQLLDDIIVMREAVLEKLETLSADISAAMSDGYNSIAYQGFLCRQKETIEAVFKEYWADSHVQLAYLRVSVAMVLLNPHAGFAAVTENLEQASLEFPEIAEPIAQLQQKLASATTQWAGDLPKYPSQQFTGVGLAQKSVQPHLEELKLKNGLPLAL